MSGSDRNGYLALVMFSMVALTAIAYVAITLAYSKGYIRADQEHERYYANRTATEQAYRDCLSAPSDELSKCLEHVSETDREVVRAEQDLNAQRAMAQWAESMLWATGIVGILSIGLTAVGVYFVKATLEQTVSATKAANEAVSVTRELGQKQIRAYFDLRRTTWEEAEGADGIRVLMFYRNHGQTPARQIHMQSCSLIRYKDGTTRKVSDSSSQGQLTGTFDVGAGAEYNISLAISPYHAALIESTVRGGQGDFLLVSTVRYKDVFGKRHRSLSTIRLEPRMLTQFGKFILVVHDRGNRAS